MPWQLSGNGRSGWSTKLIRGLKAEAAAGFQSRRERCREPTPVTPQYAAFTTYKTAGIHHTAWQHGGERDRRRRDLESYRRVSRSGNATVGSVAGLIMVRDDYGWLTSQ